MTTKSIFKIRVAAMLVFACFVFESNAQNIAITDLDGYTPASSAMLDVYSTTKGMLVPRVALVSTVSPISGTKTQGLLVWNTSTSGTYPQVGFYFWNGSNWEMVGSNNTFSNGITKTGTNVLLGGSLTQNTTITQGNYGMVHYLSGTGDFDVQDAGVSAFFVGDNGNTGIGTNSPAQKLDVAGNVRIGDNIMVEGSSTYKVYRNLVSYSASSTTGAFVINTNQPNSACMFVIKVSGYFYGSTGPYEMTVKGYGSGTTFSNTGYYSFGPDNLRVRLGVNSSNKIVLIIGDEATNYSYPKFTVTHFYQGNSAINESYADGWTMGQEPSLAAYSGVVDITKSTTVDLSDYYNKTYIDNLETTLQNNITAEDLWNRSGSYTLLKNSTDKVGIGTSAPSGILHINSTNTNTTGTDGTFLDIQNYSTTVNTMNGLRFNTGSSMYPKGGIFFQNKTTFNRGNLLFATNNTASSSNVTAADADLIINYKGDVGIGIGNADPSSRLTVKGNSSGLVDDPLFEVKNNAGQTVFAVYNEGVRIWVNDDVVKATGSRGGFAVGGISSSKGETNEFLRVTPDSVRVYVEPTAKATGSRGGFAVGGISSSKGSEDWMRLTTNNYFIGHNSGTKTTSGTFNTFFGYQAGFYNTTGNRNIYLGYQSGYNASFDNNNVFIGVSAGYNNEGSADWSGDDNIFIGNNAGYENIIGHDNVYLGNNAGKANTDIYNVIIGSDAGISSTSGFNTFIGKSAGGSAAADGNTYLGMGSGKNNVTGYSNVYLGGRAGYWNTSGNNNVLIGYGAGELASGQALGSNNIFIGYDAGDAQVGVSNKLIIESSSSTSPLIYGDFSTDAVTINGTMNTTGALTASSISTEGALGSGNLTVTGTGSISGNLTASALILAGTYFKVSTNPGSGTIPTNYVFQGLTESTSKSFAFAINDALWVTDNAFFDANITCVALTQTSDRKYKKNIVPIENSLQKVLSLNGVIFDWNKDVVTSKKFDDKKNIGFIAQDVEEIIPEVVTTDENGDKSINYGNITSVLVEAIKEQQKQIEELKAQLGTKDEQINSLRTQVERINQMQEQLDQINELLKVKK